VFARIAAAEPATQACITSLPEAKTRDRHGEARSPRFTEDERAAFARPFAGGYKYLPIELFKTGTGHYVFDAKNVRPATELCLGGSHAERTRMGFVGAAARFTGACACQRHHRLG
jgi:hypothetical protein